MVILFHSKKKNCSAFKILPFCVLCLCGIYQNSMKERQPGDIIIKRLEAFVFFCFLDDMKFFKVPIMQ